MIARTELISCREPKFLYLMVLFVQNQRKSWTETMRNYAKYSFFNQKERVFAPNLAPSPIKFGEKTKMYTVKSWKWSRVEDDTVSYKNQFLCDQAPCPILSNERINLTNSSRALSIKWHL